MRLVRAVSGCSALCRAGIVALFPFAVLLAGGVPAAERGAVGLAWLGAARPAVPEIAAGAVGPVSGGAAPLGTAFLAAALAPRVPAIVAGPGGRTGLRDLVARVEAGTAGYDAVVYGATVPPPRPPSRMTLAEIRAWIAATPAQNHAIGRYQIVPETLDRLIARMKLPAGMLFSPRLQDAMADRLMAEAGLPAFEAGELGRESFMSNLARIWAGLPGPDGRSHYHGVAGNRAGMTWASYRAGMARLYPE